ncbi:hypothetical protein [Bradyrhizobium sp. 192]|uniref:hypothetical protein n=1 Tax=Bradyrhizobium sp. 192 TaxID=2782660 RepID=UPI001FFE40F2|nr:hypothetical protein [Bradyrhizobium sp. 192]UPJ61048.1 hypothetical protein IVB24_16195 [Bradyrhizobium sp. 192]
MRLVKPITRSELELWRFQSLALWGACVGAVAAGLSAYLILNAAKPDLAVNLALDFPVVQSAVPNGEAVKRAEKIFYLLFYGFGAAVAFAALKLRKFFEGHSLVLFYLSSVIIITELHPFLRATFEPRFQALALTAMVAAGFIPFVKRFPTRIHINGDAESRPIGLFEFGWVDAVLIAALLALILPGDVQGMATRAAGGNHPVSYLTGPALYHFAKGLVPGRDFLAFYGYGPPYLLSRFLTADANALYCLYIRFIAGSLVIFHVSAYWVLRDFFQNRAMPFVLAFVFLALCQYADGDAFGGPSALAIRYMFVFIAVGILARLMVKPSGWSLAALSAVCAVSIFWNTETGIYTWAVACAALCVRLLERRRVWEVAAFTGMSIVFLLGLFVAAFGPAVLSKDFLYVFLAPLGLHSFSNWVSITLIWQPGFGTVYQIVMPAIAIGTAVSVAGAWTGSRTVERAYLLVLSLVALVFMTKWVNRSLDAVWQQNAFAYLAVGAWWGRSAFRAAVGRTKSQLVPAVSLGAVAVVSVAVLLSAQDRRQHVTIGLRSYLQYPSIASFRWKQSAGPIKVALDASDVDLVNRVLPPGGRMLLLSNQDWLILPALGRAPKSDFMPFRDMFSRDQVIRSFAGADYFFLERGATYQYDWLKEMVDQILQEQFEHSEESTRFILYRRKS